MPSSRKERTSESSVSTTLLVAIEDKDGCRKSPYMHVTVPTPSTTNSDTPPMHEESPPSEKGQKQSDVGEG